MSQPTQSVAPTSSPTWHVSRRRARAMALRPFQGKATQVLTALIATLSGGLAIYLIATGVKAGAFALVVIAPAAMILFYSGWGADEFGVAWLSKRSADNLSDLMSNDLLIDAKRAHTPSELGKIVLPTWSTQFVMHHYNIDQAIALEAFGQLGQDLGPLYIKARELMMTYKTTFISGGTLVVVAIIMADELHQGALLGPLKLTPEDLLEALPWLEHIERDRRARHKRDAFGGIGRDFAAGYTNYLDQFGVNMSNQVEVGRQVYSSLGREPIIAQMIAVLNQTTRANVALVAPAGSGKTTLIYSFAERILTHTNVGRLTYRKVMLLSPNAILAGASEQQSVEDIFGRIMDDAVRAKNVVLFFDDAQLFFEAKPGSIDATQILLQTVQNTNLPMIFSFTDSDWGRFSQVKPQALSLLNKLVLPEATEIQTLRTLEDVAYDYERQGNLVITYPALRETIALSSRYVTEKAQPAAAIDLIVNSLNFAENGYLTARSIQQTIENSTGVKVGTASGAEAQELLGLEDIIHQRMINQTAAVSGVAGALRRARAGVADPRRPIGSFLFLGPTGVGKTELARSLAAAYFSGEDKMIRLDMSEYQQPSDASRLLAAATETGTGSSFLQQVRQQPYSVVLFDEIEKAHPDILNLLLQLLDEGRLTDTAGKPVSFKDSILILTSNAGAEEIRDYVARGVDLTQARDELIDKLIAQKVFRPELLNRFDEIVLFRSLTPDELIQVVDIMVRSLNANLARQRITVTLTDDAKQFIVAQGNDPRMGARPMRRALQRFVEDSLSRKMLEGLIKPGATVTISAADLQSVGTDEPANPPQSA